MRIAISIPVHEKKDVVIDQIRNIRFYIENPVIVLHVSKSFYENEHGDFHELESINDVYINEQHINTDEKGIIYAHTSNYHYLLLHCQFDYFIMHASNDMYIKRGIIDYLYYYDAGFNIHIINTKSQWGPGNFALQDRQLSFILEKYKMTSIIGTQIESSFYKTELFNEIVKIIEESSPFEDTTLKYPREEIYFSTIAYHIVEKSRIGYPTTFSEVHRYDRCLWQLRYLTWGVYHRLNIQIIVPIQLYSKFELWYSEMLFRCKWYRIKPCTIKKLLNANNRFISKNRYLYDGRSKYQLYGSEIFSVKRVTRNINDSLRKYINCLEKSNER